MLPAKQNQGRKFFPQAVQLLAVFGVGILPHFKLLLINEIARINTNLLHPFGSLHRGIRLEVDIGHQRHMATGSAQFREIFSKLAAYALVWAVRRIISHPASASSKASFTRASVSRVSDVSMDWIRMGLEPPTPTFPTMTSRVTRRVYR